MLASRPIGGYGLAVAATVIAALLAFLSSLGAVAFAVVAPRMGGAGLGGGDAGAGGALALGNPGFSFTDAVATLLVGVSLLLWAWVALDYVYVVRPLGRGDLFSAEAPALLLGLGQFAAGGVVPGLLLLASSRSTRAALRTVPALEALRSDPSYRPSPLGNEPARTLGRLARTLFGAIWAVAGWAMFSNRFYLYLPGLIRAASQGSPGFLAGWYHFWIFASSIGGLPAAEVAGALQLVLAFGLIAGFARKLVYFLGLFAAGFLWIVPEAFGGPFAAGIFSLGPGVVYAAGLVALIAFDATNGTDRRTIDARLERRYPAWARVAEVSVGLVPQIGRWYVRHARPLARGAELAGGLILLASAGVAVTFSLGDGLAGVFAGRAANASGAAAAWFGLWASGGAGLARAVADAVIFAELGLAAALLLGIGRRVSAVVGIGLGVFLWSVVEAFGGTPGPGYTDPGVGIAVVALFVALLGLAEARAASGTSATERSRDPRTAPGSPSTVGPNPL